jgi:protocatechuate 3,4-dioxygenase beta subunit
MERGCVLVGAWLLAAHVAVAAVPELAPENAPSSGQVAPAGEPGERLVVAGRVRDAQTKTPVSRASVYIYQTDANGYYTPGPSNDNRNPRLRLHLRTDAHGAFEADTIRPGPYPRGRVPAHIHVVVLADGYARRVFEFVFDDDPLVAEQIRARAAGPQAGFVVATPAGGRIEYDILLTRP